MKKTFLLLLLLSIPIFGNPVVDEKLDRDLSGWCQEKEKPSYCGFLAKFLQGTAPKLESKPCLTVGIGELYSLQTAQSSHLLADYYALFIDSSKPSSVLSFVKVIPENDQEVAEAKFLVEASVKGNSIGKNGFLDFLQSQSKELQFERTKINERSIQIHHRNGPPAFLRQFEDTLLWFQVLLDQHRKPRLFLFSAGIKQCFPYSNNYTLLPKFDPIVNKQSVAN